jgi:hypothetical protein
MLDIVDRRPHIWHVNLQTNKSYRSHRADVTDAAVETLRPLVAADGEFDIPNIDGRKLWVTRSGKLLLATVQAETPICTIAVAAQTVGADRLWQMLHENIKLATRADYLPPDNPWAAIRTEIGLADHPADIEWLSDFERCLAWTWLEKVGPKR